MRIPGVTAPGSASLPSLKNFLDADRYIRLSSDIARRDEACIELSDDDEEDCGRFHFDEDDGREELDRVPCFTATAA